MDKRDVRTEVAGFLAQGRGRTPDTPSKITDANFPEIQRWLGNVLCVTRKQIAEAFGGYEQREKKKPAWSRGTWQGKLEDPNFASIQLTNRAGANDLSYDVRVGTSGDLRVPSVTQPQGKLSGPIGVGTTGRVSSHRFSDSMPAGSKKARR